MQRLNKTPRTMQRKSIVLTGAIGLVAAFAGLGIAGFYAAGALTSPGVLWVLAGDDRSGWRSGA